MGNVITSNFQEAGQVAWEEDTHAFREGDENSEKEAKIKVFLEKLEKIPNGDYDAHRLLSDSPQHVRANRECVLAVVKKRGEALYYAVDSLKADREVVGE